MGILGKLVQSMQSPVRNINAGGMPPPPSTMNRPSSMMGNAPFGNQLPGNQGQGAGPSASAIQAMLPMLMAQMGQGGMASASGMTPQVQAPVQAQPPNQNMFAQNSMVSEQQPQEEAMKRFNVNPQSFKFGRS